MYCRYFKIRELKSKTIYDVEICHKRPNEPYIKAVVDESADAHRGLVTIAYKDIVIRAHNIYPPRDWDGIEEWISMYDVAKAKEWVMNEFSKKQNINVIN